jgi:hypothetical protein
MTGRAIVWLTTSVITCVLFGQSAGFSQAAISRQMQPAANVPDLSGLWGPGPRGGLRWDVTGELPMTPWAAEKFKAARPPFGPNATFEGINDPVQLYCDPPGVPRIYNYPWQLTLLQTPKVVYILYEFTRTWRSVAMDRDHPKDPDRTWLGDSVGRYEGDTLVVDTVGFNEKTWLDHPGHPHTGALHIIERFRRLDHDTLEILFTVDDPRAYTKSFTGRRLLALSASPMGETLCSMSENDSFKKQIMDPTVGTGPK